MEEKMTWDLTYFDQFIFVEHDQLLMTISSRYIMSYGI